MNFIQEIKEIENERKNNEDLVIKEILDFFKEKINDDSYKDYLKKLITKKINESKNDLTLDIEFWEYRGGMFICGGYKFRFESEEYYYKGIKLRDIQHKVCDELSVLLIYKLKELGLTIRNIIRHDSNYGDYKEKIVISW